MKYKNMMESLINHWIETVKRLLNYLKEFKKESILIIERLILYKMVKYIILSFIFSLLKIVAS
jgi:hypothetical protein